MAIKIKGEPDVVLTASDMESLRSQYVLETRNWHGVTVPPSFETWVRRRKAAEAVAEATGTVAVNETMDGDFVFAKPETPKEVIDLSQAKPGDVFLTRDGREAKFIAYEPEAKSQPVVALLDGSILTFWPSGEFNHYMAESSRDIVARKPEKRMLNVWMNIKSNGQLWDYPSRFDADQNASSDRIACVPIRIEYTEGEGL